VEAPIAGQEFCESRSPNTGGQLRAQRRELKNGRIFNSRAAQPSQVFDFKSIYSAKGTRGASAEPDKERSNTLKSFPDRSPDTFLSLISAAESRKTAVFGLLPPHPNIATARAKRSAGRAERLKDDRETGLWGVPSPYRLTLEGLADGNGLHERRSAAVHALYG
jgi:hypothetical protein